MALRARFGAEGLASDEEWSLGELRPGESGRACFTRAALTAGE